MCKERLILIPLLHLSVYNLNNWNREKEEDFKNRRKGNNGEFSARNWELEGGVGEEWLF